jgi:tetratricopeptide (TPR) repeat protein
LASTFSALGQNDKALALQEKVQAASTAKLGADHPDTLTSMGNLASTYSKLGQNDKALALEEKVLAARTTKLGADHPDTMIAVANLALTYAQMKMFAKAIPMLEKYIPYGVRKEGEEGSVQAAMAALVVCLEGVGKSPDFLRVYKADTQAQVRLKAGLLKNNWK